MFGRGVQWVIMGDPMVRCHFYAQSLAMLLDVPYITMGSLVRQELSPNSPLYKKIASAVNEGKLVPEEVIFSLLSKRLEEGYCRGETGFILHGIPRTTMQAEILDEVANIDLVLNLKCAEEKQHSGSASFSPSKFQSIAAATGLNLTLNLQATHIQSPNAKWMQFQRRNFACMLNRGSHWRNTTSNRGSFSISVYLVELETRCRVCWLHSISPT